MEYGAWIQWFLFLFQNFLLFIFPSHYPHASIIAEVKLFPIGLYTLWKLESYIIISKGSTEFGLEFLRTLLSFSFLYIVHILLGDSIHPQIFN